MDNQSKARAKTAPTKRKSWHHSKVKIRTDEGQPVHVEAPGENIRWKKNKGRWGLKLLITIVNYDRNFEWKI